MRGIWFYFIINSNNVICDYGKITSHNIETEKCQLLPYGGTKAYNVYGYDANGYDNKGYKTDGYNDAGYDREGYDKNGFNADGYNRDGYKTDGFNDAGYDKDGYDRDGFNTFGYDREGYDRDGYKWDYYNFLDYECDANAGYKGKELYRREALFDRNGISDSGFNKDGVYQKTGYIYTGTEYTSELIIPYVYRGVEDLVMTGDAERWHTDGRKVNDYDAWDSTRRYNFEVAVDKDVRNYYANQGVGFYSVANAEGKKYSQTPFTSGILYITVPKSYVNRTGKKTNIYYLGITKNGPRTSTKLYKIKSKYMRIKLAYGDSVVIGNYSNINKGYVCRHPFTYKYVPSTDNIKKSSVSFNYKGKLINASETKVTVKSNTTKKDIIYTSNIDYDNVTVKSSNSAIVKAEKIKYMYSTKKRAYAIKEKWYKFDNDAKTLAVNLVGGSKKGTATVTIKDSKSGKTEKITVTNK